MDQFNRTPVAQDCISNSVLFAVISLRSGILKMKSETIRQEISVHNLSGLGLAKYVLERLVNGRDNVEKIAEEFNNDKVLILEIIDFLDEIGWIKQDLSGTYRITRKGKSNIIVRHRQEINFDLRSQITDNQ